jgi:uncharacterized protein
MQKLKIVIILFVLSIQTSQTQPMSLKINNQIILKGILEKPENYYPCKDLVIIIPGSGPTNKDGNSEYLLCNNLYMLSNELIKENIATFRFDKRGIGNSKVKNLKEEEITIDSLKSDVIKWINFFRVQKPQYRDIYLIGHSEGGLIACIVANEVNVTGVISIAGANKSADIILRNQLSINNFELKSECYNIIDSLKAGKIVNNVPHSLYSIFRPSVQPYLMSWFKYHPIECYDKVDNSKKLIIHGDKDLQIPIDASFVSSMGKNHSRLKIIENMNHLMKEIKSEQENIDSYKNPKYPISQDLIKIISGFINDKS